MILENLQVSLLRFCEDFRLSYVPLGTFINFDAAPDEEQMPRTDVVGPMALTVEVDEHFIDGTVQIGISTYEDVNNFRLSKGMSNLLEKLLPSTALPVYDATSGAVLGKMVVKSPVRLMPVINGKTRPVQFIIFSFATTQTYDLSP
jgi:hypothetical protein